MGQLGLQDGGPGLTRKQAGWFLFSRILTISLLFVATIIYQKQGRGERASTSLPGLYVLIAISYAQNLLAAILSRRLDRFRFFVQGQIGWDLLFATVFIYLTGGLASPFPFLYILVILCAAAFCRRRVSLLIAAASTILYGGMVALQYYKYLPLRHLPHGHFDPSGRDLLYGSFVHILAFFLTAFLGGVLAERLRSSEQALQRREIDYARLDTLNRAIVANIGSGLMTINQQGKIGVFNRGAEKITGQLLREIYGSDVREIFPGIEVYDGAFVLQARGEGWISRPDGQTRVVGFATSPIVSQGGGTGDLLVTFQDLTRLKEAEAQMRRNERLAAVGQLAAGLAHEIRNPLASISGSVQLLLEGGGLSEEDRRLMRIVVKEADRLNLLLSDFLRFARPAPPVLASCDLGELFGEIEAFVKTDPRFFRITIQREASGDGHLTCDRAQLRQAVLNLLINAAEAMPDGGDIWLEINPGAGTLAIEDSGPGIPPELQDRIFNPFFTTKEGGTGLGLATVHTIVEAHGGSIQLLTGRAGGGRFVLHLPGLLA